MQVEVTGADDLRRLSKRLRQHGDGKIIRRELSKGIRQELRPIAKRVQAEYRAAPSKGAPRLRDGGSLRAALARAVVVRLRLTGRLAGASIAVDPRRLPAGLRSLPELWEGRRPWKHPVHGGDRWVTQPPRPTFDRVVRPAAHAVRRRIDEVADDIARRIDGGFGG